MKIAKEGGSENWRITECSIKECVQIFLHGLLDLLNKDGREAYRIQPKDNSILNKIIAVGVVYLLREFLKKTGDYIDEQ